MLLVGFYTLHAIFLMDWMMLFLLYDYSQVIANVFGEKFPATNCMLFFGREWRCYSSPAYLTSAFASSHASHFFK